METNKKRRGKCHCGNIVFTVSGASNWVGACYCIDCFKISGSPYTVFASFTNDQIEVLKGTPKDYRSSDKVIRSFCDNCSSPFSYRYVDEEKDNLFIPVGVFDDPSDLFPKHHIWVGQKMPWLVIHDDFPQKQ